MLINIKFDIKRVLDNPPPPASLQCVSCTSGVLAVGRKRSNCIFNVFALLLFFITLNGHAHSGADHQSADKDVNVGAALHWLETSQQPAGWVSAQCHQLKTFPQKYHIIRARPPTRKYPMEHNKKTTIDNPTDILTENCT